jgi:tetratricopeptide (TPR) repeat protein
VVAAVLRHLREDDVVGANAIAGYFGGYARERGRRARWVQRLVAWLAYLVAAPEEDQRARLRRLPPGDPLRVATEARRLLALGRAEEALEHVEAALRRDLPPPLAAPLHLARVIVLPDAGGMEAACRAAREALEQLPGRAAVAIRAEILQRWVQTAGFAGRRGEAEAALEQLARLRAQQPAGAVEVHWHLARAYHAFFFSRMGEAYEAVQSYLRRARGRASVRHLLAALSQLGGIAYETGRWEEAVGANREILHLAAGAAGTVETRVACRRNLTLLRTTQALYEAALEEARRTLALIRTASVSPEQRVAAAALAAIPFAEVGRRAEGWRILETLGGRAGEELSAFARMLEAWARARCRPETEGEVDTRFAEEAHRIAGHGGMADTAAEVAFVTAWDRLRQGQVEAARAWWQRGAAFPEGRVARVDAWRVLVESLEAALEKTWDRATGRRLLERIRRAREAVAEQGLEELLWRLDWMRAQAHLQRGETRAARRHLVRAATGLMRIAGRLREAPNRDGYLARPDAAALRRMLSAAGLD